MALASTTDYETLTGTTLSGALETRVSALLEMAESAVLAAAHGQNIESATYADVVLRPHEGVLYLPQRPVTAVAEVAVVNVNGTTTPLDEGDDYRWEPGGNGRPAKIIRRRFGRDSWWGMVAGSRGFGEYLSDEVEVQVTYTAGWDSVPAPITAIVVALAKGVVDSAGGTAPTQKSVGPFSASWDAAEVRHGSMVVTPTDQATIDRFCKVRGPQSIYVHRGQP